MREIILNEWRYYIRTKLLLIVTLLFLILLVGITWLGIYKNNEQYKHYKNAKEHVREQWESIDAMNPHSAAHYGTYAFKPTTFLSSIDEGINATTGNVLRIEGHVQNEIVHSEASQMLAVSKFGKLNSSLILQYIIPLLLLFLSFSSFSKEKESGRLKLLILQGSKPFNIIIGKAISTWLYGFVLLMVVVVVQLLVNIGSLNADQFIRALILMFSYSAYYFLICSITVYFSAKWENSTATLSSMLAIWILWTVFLPGILNSFAEKIYPLPSRKDFQTAMKEDRSKGIDGHNPFDKRKKKLEEKVLKEYNVDSLSQLSINFDGIRMQADEEYGNKVWDKHFGRNNEIISNQKNILQLGGIINPFISLRNISMGISGSDYYHHQDFMLKAETYRRTLIKKLNDEHAYGGSKTGDWGWKSDNTFFKSIPDFDYITPQIESKMNKYFLDILLLGIWTVLSFILLNRASNKLRVI